MDCLMTFLGLCAIGCDLQQLLMLLPSKRRQGPVRRLYWDGTACCQRLLRPSCRLSWSAGGTTTQLQHMLASWQTWSTRLATQGTQML